jgi:hypothetical protein
MVTTSSADCAAEWHGLNTEERDKVRGGGVSFPEMCGTHVEIWSEAERCMRSAAFVLTLKTWNRPLCRNAMEKVPTKPTSVMSKRGFEASFSGPTTQINWQT